MKAYSIQGTGDRWFWVAWHIFSEDVDPTLSGYANSKGEALQNVVQSLNLDSLTEAEQMACDYAKKYRGVLPRSCRCGAFDQWEIGPGKGQHFARLICKECGKHDRWLSLPQLEVIQRRMA